MKAALVIYVLGACQGEGWMSSDCKAIERKEVKTYEHVFVIEMVNRCLKDLNTYITITDEFDKTLPPMAKTTPKYFACEVVE